MFNELFWLIYIAGVIGDVKLLLALAAFLGFLAWFACFTYPIFGDKKAQATKIGKILLSIGVIAALIATLTPSQKTFVAMIAGGAAQQIVQSDRAQELGGKTLDVLNQWLDEKLEKGDKK
jgi:hypothetical protein